MAMEDVPDDRVVDPEITGDLTQAVTGAVGGDDHLVPLASGAIRRAR
jgi:hypothetical protein